MHRWLYLAYGTITTTTTTTAIVKDDMVSWPTARATHLDCSFAATSIKGSKCGSGLGAPVVKRHNRTTQETA